MTQHFTYKHLGINGRLGNQLFQIAATASAANGKGTWNIPNWENQKYFRNILPQYPHFAIPQVTHEYREPWFHYNKIVDPEHTNLLVHDNERFVLNLHGYFQSEKYFDQCPELIDELFTFENSLYNKCSQIIKEVRQTNPEQPIVSLHLRYGDYVGNQYYANIQEDGYYHRCLNHIHDSGMNPLYIVFTDDKIMAREFMHNLKINGVHEPKYLFLLGMNEGEDLCLMSLCDHNIIANSSFSWWGSYLNKNVNKKVFAPRYWFGLIAQIDTKDLYRKNMIIL